MKTVFLRALEASDKASALLFAIRVPETARGKILFEVNVKNFALIPRSPFAYWVSEKILRLFASSDSMKGQGRLVVSTNPLNDDFRYVRAWWEPSARGLGKAWKSWAKGGSYAPFYYDIDTVISWDEERSTYSGFLGTENRPLERPASVQHFFRPALTWPRRTNGLSLRAMPKGCIFADKGPAVFVDNDNTDELLALAAVANSRAFMLLVSLQIARTELAQSYEVGLIQNTPIPHLSPHDHEMLAKLARRAWSLKKSLDTRLETSHAFVLPALLQVSGINLEARANACAARIDSVVVEFAAIKAEIDARCFDLYGIGKADQEAIVEGFGRTEEQSVDNHDADPDGDEETGSDDQTERGIDVLNLATELVSWAVGVAFGRFDVRVATHSCPLLDDSDPFDALPVCSPAMLASEDGMPLTIPPAGYEIVFPDNGILVDDRGHARDLLTAVRAVFEQVFEHSVDMWWGEVAAILEPRSHDLARLMQRYDAFARGCGGFG